MGSKTHRRRSLQTNNSFVLRSRCARRVPQGCCLSPSDRRRNSGSTPATASAHSGSPPSCPTCERVLSARLRTSRARTGARGELVFGELVFVPRVAVPESHPRPRTKLQSVPELPGPGENHELVPDHGTCDDSAPSTPLPESVHPYIAD